MTDIIEVHNAITSENFAVDPYAMRDFLEAYFEIDSIYPSNIRIEKFLQKYADEIKRISRDAHMNKGGYSNLLHLDYAPGIYADNLPACGWIKVEE